MPDIGLKTLPVEMFMREYYEPRLLPRLLSGERFATVRPISSLNRVQPLMEIGDVQWLSRDSGLARVMVQVQRFRDESAKNGKDATDAYDLRLFRDGQLVCWAPGSSLDWQLLPPLTGDHVEARELNRWQRLTHIALESGGTAVLPFDVQVPRNKDLKEVTFSAYAFNEDRVKSVTVTKTVTLPPELKARQGRAYIVSIGVNRTESSPEWDLEYAANDARRLSAVVKEKLDGTRQFAPATVIRLVSDDSPRREDELPARKDYLRTVLDLLAGRPVVANLKAEVLKVARLEQAQPEDVVILSISSHGYTDDRGSFHMVLSDIGSGLPQQVTETLQKNDLNTDMLSAWLRSVDAREMVLIVDACDSEASIQKDGFKPGPMGSRGLGQLAYDKGMRVLAASRARESAIERGGNINEGILSYALAEDGLQRGWADWQPQDGKITIGEWLAYGEKRVPELFEEGDIRGTIQVKGTPDGRRDVYHGTKRTPPSYQHPVLFDFGKNGNSIVLTRK
jgi:hypothetical protein